MCILEAAYCADVEHFAPGRRCIKVDAIDFYNHGDESISYQILWPVLN